MKIRKLLGVFCLVAGAGVFIFTMKGAWPHIKGYIDSLILYSRIQDEGEVPDGERPDREYTPVRKEPSTETPPEETEAETETEKQAQDRYDDYPEINWEKMHEINGDYIGWIYVPKTRISYPVVQSDDNIDYLHRGFDGSYLYAGSIFMDCRNKKAGLLSKRSILYGHNMRIGTMFAEIKKYQEQEYYEEHDHFWFVAEDKAYRYSVFACNIASPYDDDHFGVQFLDDDEFMEAIDKIVETSLIKTGVKVNARDHIMTLSTCTPDHARRNVVHGVLTGTVKLKDRRSEDLGETGRAILSTEQAQTETGQTGIE